MTEEEETWLVQRVMEDSMNTYDERQRVGLEEMMALSAAGDVAIAEVQPVAVKEEVYEEHPLNAFPPELVGQRLTWSCKTTEMAHEWGPSLGAPRRSGHRSVSHRRAGRWCRRRHRRQPFRGRWPTCG
ncbi:hypothetical protein D1007_58909 [Hordeum vulgare]|nr:hypothetical protein D1007_58909 [Hordeum vulgare]